MKRVTKTLAGPAGVAAATLAVHVLIALSTPLPGYFRKYALAAEQHLSGELPGERLMDFSPLYFHLSVAAERWLPAPEAAVHWLQVVLVAASAGLLFRVLRRRFAWPLAATMVAVFALDRHVLIYERILEPEVLLLFFLLGFLYVLDRGRSPILETWAAGGFAALSIATRPTFLPVFLLTPLYFALGDRQRWRRRSAALLLPVAAMLGLLMVRAARIAGDPRTPVMNPGTVFFEGNNPLSRGTSAIYPPLVLELVRHGGEIPDSAHHFYRLAARADAGRELSIAEVNAYWTDRAMAFVRAEPGRFARLVVEKLNRCFHAFRWHDIPIAWQYDLWLAVPTVSFALLATLALLGGLFEVRRWRRSLLFYAAGLAQLAVMLTFYVSARQRLILVPVAIYFAAVAVERFSGLGRRAVAWGALVLLITLVLWIPDDRMRDESYRRRGHLETDRLLHEIRDKSREEPLALHADLAVAAMASAPWWLDWLRPAYFPAAPARWRSASPTPWKHAGHPRGRGARSSPSRPTSTSPRYRSRPAGWNGHGSCSRTSRRSTPSSTAAAASRRCRGSSSAASTSSRVTAKPDARPWSGPWSGRRAILSSSPSSRRSPARSGTRSCSTRTGDVSTHVGSSAGRCCVTAAPRTPWRRCASWSSVSPTFASRRSTWRRRSPGSGSPTRRPAPTCGRRASASSRSSSATRSPSSSGAGRRRTPRVPRRGSIPPRSSTSSVISRRRWRFSKGWSPQPAWERRWRRRSNGSCASSASELPTKVRCRDTETMLAENLMEWRDRVKEEGRLAGEALVLSRLL